MSAADAAAAVRAAARLVYFKRCSQCESVRKVAFVMTAPESLMKSVMNRRFTFEGRVAVPEAKRAVRLHFEAPAHRSDEKNCACGGRCYTRHQRCGSLEREDEQMPLIAVHRAAASGLFNSALEDSACIKGNLQNTN